MSKLNQCQFRTLAQTVSSHVSYSSFTLRMRPFFSLINSEKSCVNCAVAATVMWLKYVRAQQP